MGVDWITLAIGSSSSINKVRTLMIRIRSFLITYIFTSNTPTRFTQLDSGSLCKLRSEVCQNLSDVLKSIGKLSYVIEDVLEFGYNTQITKILGDIEQKTG